MYRSLGIAERNNQKKREGVNSEVSASLYEHDDPLPPKLCLLIIHLCVSVNEIFSQGKKYSWPRPERCPVCKGNRLWSHGYVERYFEAYSSALRIKRFRCFDCSSVHTCRPDGFLKGLRFSAKTIWRCLRSRIEKGRWLSDMARQNQQYWYRRLRQWSSAQANVITPALSHLNDFLLCKTSEQFDPLLI